jgi:glycosyltransferase involved in cell wall biosynthesis
VTHIIKKMSITNKDIVILSNIEWDFQWQRHQIFATFFCASSRKVIFVESQAKRNPELKDIPRILERFLRFITKSGQKDPSRKRETTRENLTVISPMVLPSTFKIFRQINRKTFIPWLVRSIQREIHDAPIVINYSPTQTSIDIIKSLKPQVVVYDCVENFPEYPGVAKDTAAIENQIYRDADLITTDSKFLFAKARKIRPEAMRILPGVDYRHFNQADAGRLESPPKTLCYFGGIHERRIDFQLLQQIASHGFRVEIFGPVKSKLPPQTENMIFHGAIPYEQRPAHIRDFDCFILPYKISEFTKGIIPAKLFECFATGKPILATPLPSFREYEDLIYLVDSGDECIKTLERMKSLENEHKYNKRKTLAEKNSWESRFIEFRDAIENKL